MHATDIVAYTYQAETLCPRCMLLALGLTTDDASVHCVETVLTEFSEERGINRDDQRSFDSGDFPKVVFGSQIEYEAIDVPDDSFIGQGWRAERCDSCGEELI